LTAGLGPENEDKEWQLIKAFYCSIFIRYSTQSCTFTTYRESIP